jgi:hypothetical protein
MENSARLSLPYLQPSQAQKHVTHNAALERLDVLVQLAVEAFDATTPPETTIEGQVWALGAGPTGVWAGQDGMLATWSNAAWLFITPLDGWVAVDKVTQDQRVYGPAGWTVLSPSELSGLTGVGIGTNPDTFNRLVVASEATLLTHAGAGHQLKLNKAAVTDTASLLFQTGFDGRAEMGTPGSDDFAIKVSADGNTFYESVVCDGTNGTVNFPNGAEVAGQATYHRGNILGGVSQTGGLPTGAMIEQGSNANGTYVRFADGTQICWVTEVNMGSIIAAGDGSWATPYRTNPISLIWPAAFAAYPAVSCVASQNLNAGPLDSRALVLNTFESPSAAGWAFIRVSRMSSNAHDADVFLTVMAVGRWV